MQFLSPDSGASWDSVLLLKLPLPFRQVKVQGFLKTPGYFLDPKRSQKIGHQDEEVPEIPENLLA